MYNLCDAEDIAPNKQKYEEEEAEEGEEEAMYAIEMLAH